MTGRGASKLTSLEMCLILGVCGGKNGIILGILQSQLVVFGINCAVMIDYRLKMVRDSSTIFILQKNLFLLNNKY